MRNTITAAAAALLIMTTSALADGKKICTEEPQANWKPVAEAEAKTKDAGYEVRKSKTAGTCYEVYGVKGGKLFELFYHPVSLQLVMTVAK